MTLKPLITTKEENIVEGNAYKTISGFCMITHGNKNNTLITNLYDNAPEGRDGIMVWHKNMKTLLLVHSGAMQTKAYYLSYFGDKYCPINILDWYRVFLFGFVSILNLGTTFSKFPGDPTISFILHLARFMHFFLAISSFKNLRH